MKMKIKMTSYFQMGLLVTVACCCPAWVGATPEHSLENPRLNPWLTPLNDCISHPGSYALDIDMGFLNTDYSCQITDKAGVQFDTHTVQQARNDAARLVLSLANQCNRLDSTRILVGASRNNVEQLKGLIPAYASQAIVLIEKNSQLKTPDETHAKVFQLGNGVDKFFTVHGSLNLQTVGLTCKANNSLRFVEKTPVLYRHFRQLADAVEFNTGHSRFAGGTGTLNSSGTALPDAAIGNYVVQFYAGRSNGFVGGTTATNDQNWPAYINPAITGQHQDGTINWYDNAIYDAARQLRQGRSVRLDVLVFEVGEENAFVNNLWKFVRQGFATHQTEDKTSAELVDVQFPGNLQVRFLYQFQNQKVQSGRTFSNLNDAAQVPVQSAASGNPYSLVSGKVWTVFNAAGQAVDPTTPYDMHNKLVLLDVVGHEELRKLYVTSSNLDEPGQGSGKLWQAGTIVSVKPGSDIWSGPNIDSRNLWNAYRKYFEMLWNNRDGQPNAGQVNFHRQISAQHQNNAMNWIETIPSQSSTEGTRVQEGIDAFFFPIPYAPSGPDS